MAGIKIERAAKDFTPYFIEDLGAEEYHGHSLVLSSTALRNALRSPKYFHHKLTAAEKEEPSDEMILGTLAHLAILEPEKFFETTAVKPKFDMRTNKGKAESAEWEFENAGKTVLKIEHKEIIEGILETIAREKPTLTNMLKAAKQELSGFGFDQQTGYKLRIRCDSILIEDGVIFDYKTTQDASAEGFGFAIRKWRMHVQAAFYLMVASQILGRRVEMFRWVAMEKKPPYDVAVWDADPAWIEMGEQDVRRALKTIAECEKTQHWHGYQSEMSGFISPPNWLMNQYAEMEEVGI